MVDIDSFAILWQYFFILFFQNVKNCKKCLKMYKNGWKWLKMVGNGKFLTVRNG
jgi:hypothetical protein